MQEKVQEKDDESLKFRIYDSMGMEDNGGLSLDDFKAMVDGRMPLGTKVSEDVMIGEMVKVI